MTRLSPNACECSAKLSVREASLELAAELTELLKEPSRDEFSDVCYAVGRLLGASFGRAYVKMPGDRLHVNKANARLQKYGCIRSARHLVAGNCPKKDATNASP